MNKNNRNKKQKTFRLTKFTLAELERLSRELDTNMSAIVELAVARFAVDQRRGG
jgi:hypothetical protein